MRARRGFTLVEILIVVVILGILAAIVIPQFTEASTEAKLSSLCSDLQTVRSQVELYKVQHNDAMPGTATGVNFISALTKKSNLDGSLSTTGSYGPYLQAMPKNPFTDSNDVKPGTALTDVAGTGTQAWFFNPLNGDFRANDSAHKTY
jgi:general secretion pathway protein G